MTVSDRPNRSGRWTKQKIQSSRYCECPGTQTTLQSLLDTTPPKRVPVLWDGPAPAPSKRTFASTAPQLVEYALGGWRCYARPRILQPTVPSREAIYALLYWALMFLVIALIAGVLGFTGVAVASAGIAKVLFIIFLILFLVSLVTHLARGRA